MFGSPQGVRFDVEGWFEICARVESELSEMNAIIVTTLRADMDLKNITLRIKSCNRRGRV